MTACVSEMQADVGAQNNWPLHQQSPPAFDTPLGAIFYHSSWFLKCTKFWVQPKHLCSLTVCVSFLSLLPQQWEGKNLVTCCCSSCNDTWFCQRWHEQPATVITRSGNECEKSPKQWWHYKNFTLEQLCAQLQWWSWNWVVTMAASVAACLSIILGQSRNTSFVQKGCSRPSM